MHSEQWNICQSVSFSVTSLGLSRFLRRVCYLKSCGSPTPLLCQQHRRFFWRKWKNSYSVVRPTTVRPAYEVPKVSDILPPKQYQKLNSRCTLRLKMDQRCFIAETLTWNINQLNHPWYLSFPLSNCSTL